MCEGNEVCTFLCAKDGSGNSFSKLGSLLKNCCEQPLPRPCPLLTDITSTSSGPTFWTSPHTTKKWAAQMSCLPGKLKAWLSGHELPMQTRKLLPHIHIQTSQMDSDWQSRFTNNNVIKPVHSPAQPNRPNLGPQPTGPKIQFLTDENAMNLNRVCSSMAHWHNGWIWQKWFWVEWVGLMEWKWRKLRSFLQFEPVENSSWMDLTSNRVKNTHLSFCCFGFRVEFTPLDVRCGFWWRSKEEDVFCFFSDLIFLRLWLQPSNFSAAHLLHSID